MHNLNTSPTVTNCVFTGNSVDGVGGGMVNGTSGAQSAPTVTNCTFINNSTGIDGGGMFNFQHANPTVTNCTLVGNTVTGNGGGFAGGGIYNQLNDATVVNCTFSGNTAPEGGGLYIFNNSNVTVTNCTFNGNTATIAGGGIWTNTNAVVNNSVLWANSDPGGVDESAQIHVQAGTPVVTYSDIQALVPGGVFDSGANTNNINADPLFVDADGADNIPGTEDDNLRLLTGSPAIDAADNMAVPPDTADLDNDGHMTEPTPLDLDGNPRFVDDADTLDSGNGTPPIVDMGAYEFQGTGEPIPTVSEWGLVTMSLLILTAGALIVMRRRSGRCRPAPV